MGRNSFRKVRVNATSRCGWTCWMWQTRLILPWYKFLHQISIQTFLHFFFVMDSPFSLWVETTSISKQTHCRWKCLLDNCLELSGSPRVFLWTCMSLLLFADSAVTHRYTERRVHFSVTVIPIALSDYEGNFVYLNECREWRVWSRPQWSP